MLLINISITKFPEQTKTNFFQLEKVNLNFIIRFLIAIFSIFFHPIIFLLGYFPHIFVILSIIIIITIIIIIIISIHTSLKQLLLGLRFTTTKNTI